MKEKLADVTNKIGQISGKGYDFLLGRMYFTGDDGCQIFSAPMLSWLILDSNKKVTNWISTKISSWKSKPFDINLEPTMSNLNNGRTILKFNNSVLVQKTIVIVLYSNSILKLYILYELNKWPRNPAINLPLENTFFV